MTYKFQSPEGKIAMQRLTYLLSPIEALMHQGASPLHLTKEGLHVFDQWLSTPPDYPLQPVEDGRFKGRMVFEHPQLGFIVVLVSWGPGATTPIHDHNTWALMGVLRGQLEFTNFEETGQPNEVREVAKFIGHPGDVSRLVNPDMDLHRVHNPGKEIAQSLHIYGKNIGF